MGMGIRSLVLAVLLSTTQAQGAQFTFQFGSCNLQILKQTYWDTIGQTQADAWIWLGDNIYSDFAPKFWRKQQYKFVKDSAPYQRFIQSNKILGVWDDHDYGRNNVGREYRHKDWTQQLFLDFLDVPATDPRRTQDGIYASQTFEKDGAKVKVILLDLRTFRAKPNTDGEMLGAAQWAWLENQMLNPGADVLLVASSSQVFAFGANGDSWTQYPSELKRLQNLVSQSPAATIFISGDRHYGEFSGVDGVYEVTSSGLTHKSRVTPNNTRIGEAVGTRNYGRIVFDIDGKNAPKARLSLMELPSGKEVRALNVDLK